MIRIGLGYYGNSELTPTHLDIGYLRKGINDSLWLLDCVSLNRVFDHPMENLPTHNFMETKYQFRKDFCQVPITYITRQEHLYAFDSDSDAEKILENLREGSKAIIIK